MFEKEFPDLLYKFILKNGTSPVVRYPHFLSLTTLRRFINTEIREVIVDEAVFVKFMQNYRNNKRLIKTQDNFDMPRRVFVKFNPIFTITCPNCSLRRGRPRALSGDQVTKLIHLHKKGESIRSIAKLIDAKKSSVLNYIHKLLQEDHIVP
jgi:hypothetical protein